MNSVYWPISFVLTISKLYILIFKIFKVPQRAVSILHKTALVAGFFVMALGGIYYGKTGDGYDFLMVCSFILPVSCIVLLLASVNHLLKAVTILLGASLFEGLAEHIIFAVAGIPYTAYEPSFAGLIVVESMVTALIMAMLIPHTFSVAFKRPLYVAESKLLILTCVGLVSVSIYILPILFLRDFLNQNVKVQVIVGLLISCGIFLCMYFMYFKNLSKKQHYQAEALRYKQNVKATKQYYERLLRDQDKARKMNHETQTRFSRIESKLLEGDMEGALAYIASIKQKRATVKPGITGNKVVDVILHEEMEKHPAVTFSWKGHIPASLNIDEDTLLVIFANIMANAMYAAGKCSGGFVTGEAKIQGNDIGCYVQNSVAKPVTFKGGYPYNDSRGREHGHGISNILQALRHGVGDIDFACAGDTFYTELILWNVVP